MSKAAVRGLWADIDAQNWAGLAFWFAPGAVVEWPNTNERFTVQGFTRANSHYPGNWRVTLVSVERLENGGVVSVARVCAAEGGFSLHAVSFFTFEKGGKISALREYWAEDGPAPGWRQSLGLARPIE
ncbi:MAG: nuclear transport factor 2 family protein [Oscillospiraceae bacterium]